VSQLDDPLATLQDLAEPIPSWRMDGEDAAFSGANALRQARAEKLRLFLTATESDQRALAAAGALATTTWGGFDVWASDTAGDIASSFEGLDVVVVAGEYPKKAPSVCKALKAAGAKAVRLLELPGSGAALDWIDTVENPGDRLYDLAKALPLWTPPPPRSNLGLVFGRDIEQGIKPHAYLVDDLITEAEVVVVAGDSGVGKTFVVSDMAWCVARGIPFLDRFDVQRGGVVYQTGEGPTGFRSKRIPAYRQRYGIPEDHGLPFAVMPTRINLWLDEADTGKIIEDLKLAADVLGQPVKMFVVDTLTLAMSGGDENHSGDVAKILGRCNAIRDATGVAVVLVAHTPAGGGKIRGSTAWRGNVDSVLMCEHRLDEKGKEIDPKQRDSQGRAIKDVRVVKVKDGPCGWSFPYVLDVEVIGKRPNGKDISSCIVLPPNGGAPARSPDAKKPVTENEKLYLRAIASAIDEHGRYAPSGVPVAPYVKVAAKTHVRSAHNALYQGEKGADEDDPQKAASLRLNAAAKARERIGTTLVNRDFIGSYDPWLWITPRGQAYLDSLVTAKSDGVTSGGDLVTSDGPDVTDGINLVTGERDDFAEWARGES
jgi:hypothetical protein